MKACLRFFFFFGASICFFMNNKYISQPKRCLFTRKLKLFKVREGWDLSSRAILPVKATIPICRSTNTRLVVERPSSSATFCFLQATDVVSVPRVIVSVQPIDVVCGVLTGGPALAVHATPPVLGPAGGRSENRHHSNNKQRYQAPHVVLCCKPIKRPRVIFNIDLVCRKYTQVAWDELIEVVFCYILFSTTCSRIGKSTAVVQWIKWLTIINESWFN